VTAVAIARNFKVVDGASGFQKYKALTLKGKQMELFMHKFMDGPFIPNSSRKSRPIWQFCLI
jgi:hypothetical protein